MPNALHSIKEVLRFDSIFWRKFMAAGIKHGPETFVKYSPPVFGIAIGMALPEARRRVQSSLEFVRGPRSPAQEAVEVATVFANYAHCLTEAMLIGADRGFALHPCVHNAEHYYECIAAGRGVIFATAHTGGWDVAGAMFKRNRNQQVYTVMQRERDESARALQDEMRAKAGVKIIHIGDSPFDALPLLGYLKNNAVVAMQIDRSPSSMRAREVMLLDKPWRAPEGPLRLAAASGAPLLPVFIRRLGFMQYEAIVHPPVRLPRKPTPAELDQAAQRLMDALGSFLRQHPTQWFDFAREDPSAVKAGPR